MEEKKEFWTENLKAGDTVGIKSNSLSRVTYYLEKVKTITKGGNVRLENDELYDKQGYPKGNAKGHSWGTHRYLVPHDDNLKSILRKNKLVSQLKYTDFSKFNLEILEAINKILEEEEEKAI